MSNNQIESSDLATTGLEVLNQNISGDLEQMAKLEEFIENRQISINVSNAQAQFNADIAKITPATVQSFATTSLANNVAIPGLKRQIGSLTIAFAMMLEQEMRKTISVGRPKTVNEILVNNIGMSGAKQIIDILNFEKSNTGMVGGALFASLNRLTDTYNSHVVERTGWQKIAVGAGTAATLKSFGLSGGTSVLGGFAANMLIEGLTGSGNPYEKTSTKKGAAALSQSVFDTGNLAMDSLGINSKTSFNWRSMQRDVISSFNNFKRGHTTGETVFAGVALGLATGLAGWLGYKGFQKIGTKTEGEAKSWTDYILPAIAGVSTVVGGAVLGKDKKQVDITNKGNIKNIITVEDSVLSPVLDGTFVNLFNYSTLDKRNCDKMKRFVENKIAAKSMKAQKEVIIKIGNTKTITYNKDKKTYVLEKQDFKNFKFIITDSSKRGASDKLQKYEKSATAVGQAVNWNITGSESDIQ